MTQPLKQYIMLAAKEIGMTSKTTRAYAIKINKVCDYIYRHLDQDLSIENLRHVADFSKYHFHRQFSDYTGISVFKFTQLLRLKRASYQLVFNKDEKVINIAMEAGFENPESFSRAFKKCFGQTPRQFRSQPEWEPWHEKYHFSQHKGNNDMQVNIVQFQATNIAVLEHRDAVQRLNQSIARVIQWRKQTKLSPITTSNTFGLAYDDPKAIAANDFRFDICGSVQTAIPENNFGIINKQIPGGRCAVIRHCGSHDLMDAKVHYLYAQWLPDSGEELRDFPCYFHYINLFPDVPEHALITDIYLPLK
jgi:AraC family transcriptional regulator